MSSSRFRIWLTVSIAVIGVASCELNPQPSVPLRGNPDSMGGSAAGGGINLGPGGGAAGSGSNLGGAFATAGSGGMAPAAGGEGAEPAGGAPAAGGDGSGGEGGAPAGGEGGGGEGGGS